MLFKRYESTEVDRRTWLHVPSGTHWSTSSGTHQVVEIQIETSTNKLRLDLTMPQIYNNLLEEHVRIKVTFKPNPSELLS